MGKRHKLQTNYYLRHIICIVYVISYHYTVMTGMTGMTGMTLSDFIVKWPILSEKWPEMGKYKACKHVYTYNKHVKT